MTFGDYLRHWEYEKHFWRAFENARLSASREVFLNELVSCPTRNDVAFLLCGKKCMTSEIDPRTLTVLEEAIPEMIVREGAYVRLQCAVIPGIASCSLVDIPVAKAEDGWEVLPRKRRPTDSVHFGFDTFVMLEEIKRVTSGRRFCNGLDLCCGSGALTFFLSNRVSSAIGVDTNIRAIEMARLGSRLNGGVQEFINGDVRYFENSTAFDLIVCNPPYVPVPPGFHYPDYGNGGLDGEQIVSVVTERMMELLAVNGLALVMFLDTGTSCLSV
ncbi:methyltransferase, partial [candidate division KSB1 bacterium]